MVDQQLGMLIIMVSHVIGIADQQYNMEFDGHMSQFYWIDGQITWTWIFWIH